MNNGSWLRAAGSLLPFIPSPLHLLLFPQAGIGQGKACIPLHFAGVRAAGRHC